MNVKYFDNYKLQIEIIDNEHYQLLSICSKIIKTIENKELSLVLLKKYYDLTAKHFKNEEQYMESIKFPYIKYHAEVHLKILNKIIIVLNNKEPYSYIMQKYYIKTIDDTLLKHIDEHDRQISEYLKTITLIKP